MWFSLQFMWFSRLIYVVFTPFFVVFTTIFVVFLWFVVRQALDTNTPLPASRHPLEGGIYRWSATPVASPGDRLQS